MTDTAQATFVATTTATPIAGARPAGPDGALNEVEFGPETDTQGAPAEQDDDLTPLPPLTGSFGPGTPAAGRPTPDTGRTPAAGPDDTSGTGPDAPAPGSQPGPDGRPVRRPQPSSGGPAGPASTGRTPRRGGPSRPGGHSRSGRGAGTWAPRLRRAAAAVRQLATGATPAPRPIVVRTGRGSTFSLAGLDALLGWLGGLVKRGQLRGSRLTTEGRWVIAILLGALFVALGGLSAPPPSPVEAPDALPAATATAGAPSAAPTGGGMVDDPTSKGRITATTAHGLAEIRAQFGPVLRGEHCWDLHPWNKKSDHRTGKGCDIYTSPAKQFASGDGLANGNRLVAWLRQNASPLQVKYVIWQGRIWYADARGDQKYNGGGVYDPNDATGGHFDHVHVSFRE